MMSKQGKRKITVELPKSKDLGNRPSVFERLGTKKTSTSKKTSEYCRQWAQHGSCAYGKGCKFAGTHTLISPSKQRAANKDGEQKRLLKDDGKNRLHSTVVVRSGRSPDGEIDNWDQNDLDYADTDVLEKRRQQLQRELELQMKMDSSKDIRKEKKKAVSSSSSSLSSSTSSITSSSSDGSSSSSSIREAKKKKKGKLKRNSTSSSDVDVSKKKYLKVGALKRDKSIAKKTNLKKDERILKKSEVVKKKILTKTIGKKSLSPGKKSGGTPPITSKSNSKNYTAPKHKSPVRREKNRSISPHTIKEREKERERAKERERDKEKDRDKERDRNRARSKSPRSKARSRSPLRRHGSNPKDPRKKDSSERIRPLSPKKQARRHVSADRHRKSSISRDRDRGREHKDRSLERRKDKHDDKDRHERERKDLGRGRDRLKDPPKRDLDNKRSNRGRDRGLARGGADKGLEKPNKPMERLLPRPEERLAALAATSNRVLEADKSQSNVKDRQDSHTERGGRKQDRTDRDRSNKRGERIESVERDRGEYDIGLDSSYDHNRPVEHYDRVDEHYNEDQREEDCSPGYGIQGRERHYDPGYDLSGPSRGYPDDEDRPFGEHINDHRGIDMGYDDRRPHRDRSWEGRSGSLDRERGYGHPHKEWENEDYRGPGEWNRDRHWSHHEPQMGEWGDKESEMEPGWHHRGPPPGPHRPRVHDEYARGMRMEHGRQEQISKRRPQRTELEAPPKEQLQTTPQQAATPAKQPEPETEDNPIPDDLSEISDDPDDILNREDMLEQNIDDDSQMGHAATDEANSKAEVSESHSTQDTSAGGEEKESQEPKDEEDVTNLDFEEISDGELEEERTRGLGDALGVDWASLVTDMRRREQVSSAGGARDRWRPERVLTRIGVSLEMAGSELVSDILKKNAEVTGNVEENEISNEKDGKNERVKDKSKFQSVDSLHPVASIQVAIEKRRHQRAVLFGSGCEITRALCARRDLALRRHLCKLPTVERTGQSRVTPQAELFHAAQAMLVQATASG